MSRDEVRRAADRAALRAAVCLSLALVGLVLCAVLTPSAGPVWLRVG